MKIDLKRATVNDIPALIKTEESIPKTKIYSPMLGEQDWKEALERNRTYLIEMDGEIVGNVSYEIKGPQHVYIDGLVVMPQFQGKGIGRKAIEEILEELKEVPLVDLVTHPENIKAIKVYESLGFKKTEQIENYFGDGEPRIRMVFGKVM